MIGIPIDMIECFIHFQLKIFFNVDNDKNYKPRLKLI